MNLNPFFVRMLTVVSFLVFSASTVANDSLAESVETMWKSLESQTSISRVSAGKIVSMPLTTRVLELDEPSLKALLDENISETYTLAAKGLSNVDAENNSIVLPLPDGSEVTFKMTPNTVMPEALSQKFPDIKTWKVSSVDGDITGVIDFTHHGFHGMLFMPNGDRVFIEPNVDASISDRELSEQGSYISFSQKQNEDSFQTEFSCGVDDSSLNFSQAAKTVSLVQKFLTTPPSTLITYRLAVATTGEYTQYHGGSVELALSAVVTTISRVNEIFTRDLGVQLELVEEQSDIIYSNPTTDPYSNSSFFEIIEENNQNLSIEGALSKDKYDIGHVFGTGNGGLAILGGVCLDDLKASGATGLSNPFGEVFAIDFVAHEIGHQLGASHTFNSECGDGSERTPESAVEAGSGTTIMAYAGICQENNIQTRADPQFHIANIYQVNALTRSGSGSSCGTNADITNANPTVDAGEDYIVPARTPIKFVAIGSDADNDIGNDLTYSWEQIDVGASSDVNVDTGDNALFRSRPLTSENIRYIPMLSDLFDGTYSDGELLPITDRDINMVATIRDGLGGLEADEVNIEVVDTGDIFSITSHTRDQSFGRQDIVNMSWEVADTDLPPISCLTVDIGVITRDGNEFKLLSTANDGEEQFLIPNDTPAIGEARFILSCSDSNFFNVSNGEITILDQVNGGSIVNQSNVFVASDQYSADSPSDNDRSSSGNDSDGDGGGSYTVFMLLLCLSLFFFQRQRVLIKGRVKLYESD